MVQPPIETPSLTLRAFVSADVKKVFHAAQDLASQGVLLRAGFTRMNDGVMRFQGVEQAVVFYAFAREA